MHYSQLLSCVLVILPARTASVTDLKPRSPDREYGKRQAEPMPGQLQDFQVHEPVLVPEGTSNEYGCVYTMTLMEHDFFNSYGAPFVGSYTPPPCDFNRVVMNLTVTSSGRQFDRLALMYLSDTEVFRTSTAEPTKNGIIWSYMKEMQMYNALWKQPQKIIFDLGNTVDSTYTGPYNTTLTATFFTVPDSPATADEILPISSRSSSTNSSSVFTVPAQNASVEYTLPQNVNRAVISLSACGQINEEFWYSNVPNSDVNTFANTTGALIGGGTFREVQLLIDGQLSGVSWPFPVIFTGGIVPGFWRPIVGIDAFDLRQHEIDITPWLGYLLDGEPHTFEIQVMAVSDDGHGHVALETVPAYWLVSGSIFLFLGPEGSTTSASMPLIDTPAIDLSFASSYTQTANGTNNTLSYSTNATRNIAISSTVKASNGSSIPVSWTQKLSYTNTNYLTDYGMVQLTNQTTTGSDIAVGLLNTSFSHLYSYPLYVNSSYMYSDGGNSLFLAGQLSRGKQLTTLGNPVFPTGLENFNTSAALDVPTIFSTVGNVQQQQLPPGAADGLLGEGLQGTLLNTTQVGTAQYQSTANSSSSFGTTEQWFDFEGVGANGGGINTELYNRHVKAVNASVVEDEQTFLGRSYGVPTVQNVGGEVAFTVQDQRQGGVRQFIGRGRGQSGHVQQKRQLWVRAD